MFMPLDISVLAPWGPLCPVCIQLHPLVSCTAFASCFFSSGSCEALRTFLVLLTQTITFLSKPKSDTLCKTKQFQYLPLNAPNYCFSSCKPFIYPILPQTPLMLGMLLVHHEAANKTALLIQDGQNPTFLIPSLI